MRATCLGLGAGLVWGSIAFAGADRCVQDDQSTSVCVEHAQRIVSLAPHATELIDFVGGLANLVAVDSASDYPASVKNLPQVGDSQRVDLEGLLALRPDLIVAWESGVSPQTIQTLRALGLPVFVSEPKSFADVARSMTALGYLLGQTDADDRAAQWSAQFEQLRMQYAEQDPIRVLYQVWEKPLMVIGGTHWIDELIALCGGTNVFAGLAALAPTVSLEAAVQSQPDLILSSGQPQVAQAALAHWRRWSSVPAVRNGQIRTLAPDVLVRAGPRLIEGATALCGAIAQARGPELFSDRAPAGLNDQEVAQ